MDSLGLVAHEHYLGHRNAVGENLRYLVRDRFGRAVACALFGSAAWKCADRDAFLGWDRSTRERNLQRLINNTRFLIPGWVQVPHLASSVSTRGRLPAGVVRMLTRQEAESIYDAGKETVVRVLLELSGKVEQLTADFAALKAENVALRQRVQTLEEQVAKDSHNSHKPPSSDGQHVRLDRPAARRSKAIP